LDFARSAGSGSQPWSDGWPCYDIQRRATRVIRTLSDAVVEDPDAARRSAWNGRY
jgi:para-nitrobenzyl esterase